MLANEGLFFKKKYLDINDFIDFIAKI